MTKFTKQGYDSFYAWGFCITANAKQTFSRSIFLGLLLCLLLPRLSFGQSPIGQPGTAAGFEIDANFLVNNQNLKDWRSVFQAAPNPTHAAVEGENAKWIVDGNSGIGTELEVFRGSSNKNGDFINAAGSPYLIETSSPSTPQKNDITNVYSRSTVIAGHQWVMLGAETRSVDGTSYLDFEYNKKGVHTTGANLIGDGTEGGRTARNGTIAGDALFVVDFSKGGNAPIPRVFEWRATGKTKPAYDWFELPVSATAPIFIVTNGADVETLISNSGFAGNGTPSNTTLALQFVEIGVDLTYFGLDDNVCSPSATITCKTRTSSSYTSELKDFTYFNFSVVPSGTLTDLSNQTVCSTSDFSFATTAGGPGASAANIKWYKVDGTTETEIVDNNTKYDIVVNGATNTLTVHNAAAGDAGTYRAKLTGSTCGNPSEDATFTLYETAALTNVSPQTKCPGASVTASFSTTVSGTGATASNVEWYFGATKLTNGTKYTIGTNGNTSTLTINAVEETNEGTYTAKLTGATCGAPEKSNTLTVNPVPDANAGADPDAQCYKQSGNEFTLDGSLSVNGTAKWTRFSPATLPAGVTVVFDNDESFTPKVTVSGATAGIIVTLRLTVTSNASPACGSDFDDVTIEVKAQAMGTDGVIQPITCTDVAFKLKLTPVAGTTYTVTQPCNDAYSSTGTLDNGSQLFTGLKFGAGYQIVASKDGCVATPVICGGETCTDICPPVGAVSSNRLATTEIVEATIQAPAPARVLAAPNPFNDRIRFSLQSAVSGKGSLELYNMLGQKVKVVYQGHVQKGVTQNIEYNVPGSQRANLIYVFTVGDQRVTGKLIGPK